MKGAIIEAKDELEGVREMLFEVGMCDDMAVRIQKAIKRLDDEVINAVPDGLEYDDPDYKIACTNILNEGLRDD